jgi:hypothetical protein
MRAWRYVEARRSGDLEVLKRVYYQSLWLESHGHRTEQHGTATGGDADAKVRQDIEAAARSGGRDSGRLQQARACRGSISAEF